jgi:hypothetical protein
MNSLDAGPELKNLGRTIGDRLAGPLVQLKNLLHLCAAQLVLQSDMA